MSQLRCRIHGEPARAEVPSINLTNPIVVISWSWKHQDGIKKAPCTLGFVGLKKNVICNNLQLVKLIKVPKVIVSETFGE